MLNRLFTVDTVTLTSTGTAVSNFLPYDMSTRKLPTQVVIRATGQGAYVRLSDDQSAATNADLLVQAGDHAVVDVLGRHWVSVLSDGASSTVSIGALSTGVWGDAATLNLNFTAGTLDPRITFTRADASTCASYFDQNGVLRLAAANVARFDYDPATRAAQGLLIEESRTNSLTYSEQFDNVASWAATGAGGTVTANQAVAPDGNTTADQLTFTANSVSGVRQNVTLTAASYTLSCWMRSISGAATARLKYFNGTTDTFSSDFALTTTWQRFSFTFTGVAVAGNISISNSTAGTIQNIYIWGAQLEAGAFQTSYIPTTTTALTRSADVASVNTLSPWYNATAGTMYSEFQSSLTSTASAVNSFNDGTANNRVSTFASNLQFLAGRNTGGAGVLFTPATANAPTVNVNKVALAFANLDVAICGNGGTVATAATYNVPTVTKLELGNQLTAGYLNGYLRRITYYPRRLENNALQALTL